MKHILISILLLLPGSIAFSQAANDTGSVFKPIHILPKFPGGSDSLDSFIYRNLKCPPSFGSEGMVIINFFVEKDGTLTNAGYSNTLTPDCDKEAMRVFNLMPKWIPATEFEKPIRNYYYVHFRFRCK